MIRRFVTINRSSYAVPSREAFLDLKAQVLAAALAGAGMVNVPGLGDGTISVLITPHHSVVFEERQVDEDDYCVSDSGVEFLGSDSDEFANFDY